MSKIKSVDNSYGSDGQTHHFVTLQNDDGSQSKVEVDEAQARAFQKQLRENGGNGRRMLTETDPYIS